MKRLILCCFILLSTVISNAQILAGFEAWHNYTIGTTTYSVPNGWTGSDSLIGFYGGILNPTAAFLPSIEKELPGNGSATALKVVTKNQPALGTFIPAGAFPATCTNGEIIVDVTTGDISFLGGTPFVGNPTSVSVWVKNLPINGDSTEITVFQIDDSDGDNLDKSVADTVLFETINSFTKITFPFVDVDPGLTCTHLRVLVSSSSNGSDTSFAGTTIIVDDITINFPSGVSQYLFSNHVANVYPTYVERSLFVNLNVNVSKKYLFQIIDLTGKIVFQELLDNQINKIDLLNLNAGIYFYDISFEGKKMQSGKFVKK